MNTNCVLLTVYSRKKNIQFIKEKLYENGCGEYQHYINCSWQTSGIGEYKRKELKNMKKKRIREVKLEIVCPKKTIKVMIDIVNKYHDYEEPAYYVATVFSSAFEGEIDA